MKILLFLPAVTPWWFDFIIAPMMRTLVMDQRVSLHVVTGKLWRNTGITPENYLALGDLPRTQWHIVGGADPQALRFAAATLPGLPELVAAIDPDLVLARSAEFGLGGLFPGALRYLMEGAAPPFATDPTWIVLDEEPFHHGFVPAGQESFATDCAEALSPAWEPLARRLRTSRAALGLPADRPVLAVPLLYEHEENLFLMHSARPTGLGLLQHLLAATTRETLLAVSDHPLNRLHAGDPAHPFHIDRRPVDRLIAAHGERMELYPRAGQTDQLAAVADAMVVDLSKSWSLGAFLGTPLVRLGNRPMADWLNPIPGAEALPALPRRDALPTPDAAAARRWFGWHFGARLAEPALLDTRRLLRLVNGEADEADAACTLALVHARQEAPA